MKLDQTHQKGDIYYIKSLDTTPIGFEMWSDRPAIIVSNNVTNSLSGFINVVYLTTSISKKFCPTHIAINSGDKKAIALCEQIHTIDKSRIGHKIGNIDYHEQLKIDKALCCSLGIEDEHKNYAGLFKKWEAYIHRYNLSIPYEHGLMRDLAEADIVSTLTKQVKILTCERDGYKTLILARDLQEEYTKNINEGELTWN